MGERSDRPRDQNASPPSESWDDLGPRVEWRNMRSEVGPPSWKRSEKWVCDEGEEEERGWRRPQRNVALGKRGWKFDAELAMSSAEAGEGGAAFSVSSTNGDGVASAAAAPLREEKRTTSSREKYVFLHSPPIQL